MPSAVAGDEAAGFKVIRIDSYADAHKGKLLAADETSGKFSWIDHVNGETREMQLPPRSIRIVRR